MSSAVFLLVVGISAWVYFDAKAIGVRKGLMPGPFDMTPLGWAGLCLLLWIVWFPIYLSKRTSLRVLAKTKRADTAEAADDAEEEVQHRQADEHPSGASHADGLINDERVIPPRRVRRRAVSRRSS